jgi:tRNA (guanine26-N2/guanine27-N2)-dimethyltransferase
LKSTLQPQKSIGTQIGVTEGKVSVFLPPAGKTTVFYNPRMSLNRDIAVLFATSHFPPEKQLHVCDPMAGSGVRAARYVRESPNVRSVVAADKDSEAVNATQRTIELNGLEAEVLVLESDANVLLTKHMEDRFDLVDLDPFGCPSPFFESALRATLDGGVLAITATDMGPLTGARPAACFRKYGANPVRTEFEKELAVRILAGCLARTASKLNLGVDFAFTHASDHYARIYASLSKGKTSANHSAKKLGFLEYCPKCLMRKSCSSLDSIQLVCENCKSKVHVGGPIWLGRLWDRDTVRRIVERTPPLASSRLTEIQMILSRIAEELDSPAFYYRTDEFARNLRIKPPSLVEVIEALRDAGYKASRTHFDPVGFRTEGQIEAITALLRSLAEKIQAQKV